MHPPPSPVDLQAVTRAADRLRPFVRETPTVYSYTFSELAGRDVWLKLENLQRTGSFKVRGALNKIFGLPDDVRARGLVAASAGNHSQGVALASQLAGVPCTVVMPISAPLNKVRRTEDYGARVVLHGESWDEAQAHASTIAASEGLTGIHPFDDPEVIAGQGTVGLEILEQLPDVECIVCPVGGGGLLAGIAVAVRALRPQAWLVGVQAAGADAMARSFRSGTRETVARPRTLADGIRVGTPGVLTFETIRANVDAVVTVDEEAISAAVVEALSRSKVMVEPGGAVGLAALATGAVDHPGPICVVLSGGNIDLNLLGHLIESGLASQGFLHPVQLRLDDVPGQLQRVLELLARDECNVLDVQHYRGGWRVPVGKVDVEILIETRRANQGRDVEALLGQHGFEVLR